jgi:hypothetical protein
MLDPYNISMALAMIPRKHSYSTPRIAENSELGESLGNDFARY